MAEEGVRATLMLPLLAGEKPVGVFFLDSLTPGAYTERDLELVDPVAQQLALAIENAAALPRDRGEGPPARRSRAGTSRSSSPT